MDIEANGEGVLRRVIDEARLEEKCSREALTVLANHRDPYRIDTPANHRDAQWAVEQFERAVRTRSERRIHERGLHYAIVAAGNVLKPDGSVYTNTEKNDVWLRQHPVNAARWLGYIPFDAIVDERNERPVIHRRPSVEVEPYVSIGLDVSIPDADEIEPYVGCAGFEGRQAFHLVIFGEKSSIGEVVTPIAERHDADIYLMGGEISNTRLHEMAADGAEDGRPMIVFTISDFDPAGWQMPVSIGRKLQAFRDTLFPELEFAVLPIAMTEEQVREHDLPSTPLKEGELRADRWRAKFGLEQTEIDALAQLRPEILEQIVTDAIAPFWDATLEGRCASAWRKWKEWAQRRLDAQVDEDTLEVLREQAAERLAELEEEIDAINERLRMATTEHVELPPAIVPEPIVDMDLDSKGYLISSGWTWAEGTRALIKRKRY